MAKKLRTLWMVFVEDIKFWIFALDPRTPGAEGMNTDAQKARFDEVMAEAEAIVDSWDRSSIGSLGVHRDLLVKAMLPKVAHVGKSSISLYGFNASNTIMLGTYSPPTVKGEVALWNNGVVPLYRNDDPLMEYFLNEGVVKANKAVLGEAAYNHCLMLQKVIDNPSYLPYFEKGVFNEEFIKRCLLEDIDAELASAVA